MNRYWLYHLLVMLELNRYASGAAQPGLAVNKLEDIRISVPHIADQNLFSALAEQSDKSKFELTQAISRIDDMIKALMQG